MIAVENLVKHFGSVKAVDDISFSVGKGEIFGFLGPNGAGKSTALRCMMSLLFPNSGSVEILGSPVHGSGGPFWKEVGFLDGEVRLYSSWTGEDHVRFLERLYGQKGVAEKLAKRLNFDLSLRVKTLSSGNRQKLGLLLSLLFQPKVLILDEPTNALDPILQHVVYDLILEAVDGGASVLMSSHNLSEVERICTRVGVIREGKMVAVERIDELQKKRATIFDIQFSDVVSKKQLQQYSSHIQDLGKSHFQIRAEGDVSLFLSFLS